MDNNFTNIDRLITDYVKGNLKGDTLELFELKLAHNKELQEKVALEKAAHNLFLDADALILKEMMMADMAPKSSSSTNKKWWLGGLGLAIVITSGLLLFETEKEIVTEEVVSVESVEVPKVESQSISNDEKEHVTTRETHVVKPEHFEELIDSNSNVKIENVKEEIPEIVSEEVVAVEINTEVAVPEEEKIIDPCDGVTFKGELKIKKADKGETNGVVTLHEELITGGTKPYLYSMDREGFSENTIFEDLSPSRKYGVFIQDANGCVALLNGGAFHMGSTQCKTEYQPTFSIAYEQDWELPVNENSSAEITLVNRVGQELVRYQLEEGGSYRWDGIFDNGNKVTPGRFNWHIEYQDGEQCVVKLTVLN